MDKKKEQELLNKVRDRTDLPKHIAIIMDGNGRWAKKRHLPRIYGHRAGIKSVREVIKGCIEVGIEVLTLYAFSTENWQRPKSEVKTLMTLLQQYLRKELDQLQKNNIRLVTIGEIEQLPKTAQQEIKKVTTLTAKNTRLILNLALNYGSRQEIVFAVNKLLQDGKINKIPVDEKIFSNYLYTKDLPEIDLLIRTSGELRISNFLLWQVAYAELYFTPVLWPDFNKAELYNAVLNYQSRERRFGGL